MLRHDLSWQVAVVLLIVIPGNFGTVFKKLGPPGLAVQPVPAPPPGAECHSCILGHNYHVPRMFLEVSRLRIYQPVTRWSFWGVGLPGVRSAVGGIAFSRNTPPPSGWASCSYFPNYHLTQCGRAHDCQAKRGRFRSRLRRNVELYPTHLQLWAL
jgi:hypothetical protein